MRKTKNSLSRRKKLALFWPFLTVLGVLLNGQTLYAYPSQQKWWVLPFKVYGSTDTELGVIAARSLEAALSTTYEGNQLVLGGNELSLALALTDRSLAQALNDEAWISRTKSAANVTVVVRGALFVEGSSVAVAVGISTAPASKGISSPTGPLAKLPALTIRAARMIMYARADNFWSWTDAIPMQPRGDVNADLIRAIGHLGSQRYTAAIDVLKSLIWSGPQVASDARYWLFQAYALAHLTEEAEKAGKDFIKWNPDDPRVVQVKEQLKTKPLTGFEPPRDKS